MSLSGLCYVLLPFLFFLGELFRSWLLAFEPSKLLGQFLTKLLKQALCAWACCSCILGRVCQAYVRCCLFSWGELTPVCFSPPGSLFGTQYVVIWKAILVPGSYKPSEFDLWLAILCNGHPYILRPKQQVHLGFCLSEYERLQNTSTCTSPKIKSKEGGSDSTDKCGKPATKTCTSVKTSGA